MPNARRMGLSEHGATGHDGTNPLKAYGNYHKLYFYERFKNYFVLEILLNIKYYQFTTHGIFLPLSKVLNNQIKMLFFITKITQ